MTSDQNKPKPESKFQRKQRERREQVARASEEVEKIVAPEPKPAVKHPPQIPLITEAYRGAGEKDSLVLSVVFRAEADPVFASKPCLFRADVEEGNWVLSRQIGFPKRGPKHVKLEAYVVGEGTPALRAALVKALEQWVETQDQRNIQHVDIPELGTVERIYKGNNPKSPNVKRTTRREP
ncbi:MAG: hypothetical protein DI551_03910 [Micavibrio aeruginosavorus]|uniref:Uncharacterized protein n=1 Tax=Micavibrio aeruginosavorus TaxID=349221 RepID=A0A2W5N124_9BACT|nr:MAG: hypothetical protein DI551_03910 [Micavibrio aeruginosavorus]